MGQFRCRASEPAGCKPPNCLETDPGRPHSSEMIEKAKQWARVIKRDAHALYLAARDPRVPWYAKALALCVAGYALSPIDLIPDFIPVLGYLDDRDF